MQLGLKPEKFGEMTYWDYHQISMMMGDVDPSYEMLRYLCNRFELNMEQRYWLAFLYATCYCGPTVYYIYNEFPDFETVDIGRLERWWAANRKRLVFQTDRQWVRSRNQFCDMYRSYVDHILPCTQEERFTTFKGKDRYETYDRAWAAMSQCYQMGRFAMFLYLEAVHVVTDFPMRPKTMDLREAESCRNGLAFAIGRPDLNTHRNGKKLTKAESGLLQREFDKLVHSLEEEDDANSVWNIETTLCAYKKYHMGKRWPGYYLDRQHDEIVKMQKLVPEGVCWDVLWDYRKETYVEEHLKEFR